MFFSAYKNFVHHYYLNILFLNRFVMNTFILLTLLSFIFYFCCSISCLANENTDIMLKEIESNRILNEVEREAQMLKNDLVFQKKLSDKLIRCKVIEEGSIELLKASNFPWEKVVSVEVVTETPPISPSPSSSSTPINFVGRQNNAYTVNQDIPYSVNLFVHGGISAFTGLGATSLFFEKAVHSRVINGTIMYKLPFNKLVSAPAVGKIGFALGTGVFLGGIYLSDLDSISSLIK